MVCACGSAGTKEYEESYQTSETQYLTLTGYLGLGLLNGADINIIDISNFDEPKIISATESDSTGKFSFEWNLDEEPELVMIVASGGTYVDPFSFSTVSAQNYELRAIYKTDDFSEKIFYLTPFSTLFSSFVEGLHFNSSLSDNAYYYAQSIFNTVFGVELDLAEDIYLNEDAENNNNNRLYTIFNLAFSKLSQDQEALSGLDVTNVFSQNLIQNCNLITSDEIVSHKYRFSPESFREDFLNSFLSLENNSVFSEISDSINFDSISERIRSDEGLIFGFNTYEE